MPELSEAALNSEVSDAAPNRAQRRRMQTREKLLDAGRIVFAKHGLEAATIEEITETADVGRGSFYNFFDTKEDLVAALVDDVVERLAAFEAASTAQYEDPIIALTVSVRSAFHVFMKNEVLAWFILRTQRISGAIPERFIEQSAVLIEQARERHRLKIDNAEIAVILLGGGIFAALEMLLVGRLPRGAVDQVVDQLIAGLGVTPALRRKALSTPLPDAIFVD